MFIEQNHVSGISVSESNALLPGTDAAVNRNDVSLIRFRSAPSHAAVNEPSRQRSQTSYHGNLIKCNISILCKLLPKSLRPSFHWKPRLIGESEYQ